jgi:predicted nucleotidyltransferase
VKRTKSDQPETVLLEILKFLQDKKIPHLLIGALAVGVWARPRTTLDIDLLIAVSPENFNTFSNTAPEAGFQVDRQWWDENPLLRDRQVRLRRGSVSVDLRRAEGSFEQHILRRKRRKRLGKHLVWVASPEDLILMKLRVGRPRDFEDASALVVNCKKEIDFNYLSSQAGQLGLVDELQFILK